MKRLAGRMLLISLIITLATLFGAGCKKKEAKTTQITDITRVFMHEPGHYTLFYQPNGSNVVSLFEIPVRSTVKIITDVSIDKSSWAKIVTQDSYNCGNPVNAELHIHVASEINGGGWNHGKFGSGQTTVVE